MSIGPTDVARWQEWVGRREARTEPLCEQLLARYAAAIGEPIDDPSSMPSLAHWALFADVRAPDDLGEDGHPRRGGFLPPVSLPRRMFASAKLSFAAALDRAAPVHCEATVLAVSLKSGRDGDLVLVELEYVFSQTGAERLREHRTILYRGDGVPVRELPEPAPVTVETGQRELLWEPRPQDLFRFSAATFNGHRIHYDASYAQGREGYPALVVHGPFTAARLFGLARADGELRAFAFRALAPLFVSQPIRLRRAEKGLYQAIRTDGVVAMTATAHFQGG